MMLASHVRTSRVSKVISSSEVLSQRGRHSADSALNGVTLGVTSDYDVRPTLRKAADMPPLRFRPRAPSEHSYISVTEPSSIQ